MIIHCRETNEIIIICDYHYITSRSCTLIVLIVSLCFNSFLHYFILSSGHRLHLCCNIILSFVFKGLHFSPFLWPPFVPLFGQRPSFSLRLSYISRYKGNQCCTNNCLFECNARVCLVVWMTVFVVLWLDYRESEMMGKKWCSNTLWFADPSDLTQVS
jgi:hypothetical protein